MAGKAQAAIHVLLDVRERWMPGTSLHNAEHDG